jgi:phospholipase C
VKAGWRLPSEVSLCAIGDAVRRGTASLKAGFLLEVELLILVLATVTALGCETDQPSKIQHVMIIVQENRTPDNLFHGLPQADIADSGVNSKGERIPLTPASLTGNYDLNHSHLAFLQMYDDGKMDGADKIAVDCAARTCTPNPQFKYVEPSEVAPYFQLAEEYTFGDRMFQTNQGPSFPAHQFIISGTSAPAPNSDFFAAENISGVLPVRFSFVQSACGGLPGQTVALIGPTGEESTSQAPCFEHLTLMDLLDHRQLDWRYYSTHLDWETSLWTAPNAIRHLRVGPDWAKVIPSPIQVLRDISNGQLASVSWVTPRGQDSDHPSLNEGSGPSWVAALVNAVGNSQYWSNTAIFIIWDDWGGWYDHVAPPIYNSYEYGFRVPLIVVSAYAKPHYVSHQMHDFGSILRFVEENFQMGTLGYADARADALSDCFDFNQTPLPFSTIVAPLSTDYFLDNTTPDAEPDDD